jgi:hypothetical protein
MLPSSPPETLSFAEPRGRDVSLFEKVLVSTGNYWSHNMNEGKEVSYWIGIGSSVSEIMDLVEEVFVVTRTCSSSSDEEFKVSSRC